MDELEDDMVNGMTLEITPGVDELAIVVLDQSLIS